MEMRGVSQRSLVILVKNDLNFDFSAHSAFLTDGSRANVCHRWAGLPSTAPAPANLLLLVLSAWSGHPLALALLSITEPLRTVDRKTGAREGPRVVHRVREFELADAGLGLGFRCG